MNDSENTNSLRWMHFTSELEEAFQRDQYRKLLPVLRTGLTLVVVLHLLLMLTQGWPGEPLANPFFGFVAVGSLILCCTIFPAFERAWQPVVVLSFCGLAYLILQGVPQAIPTPLPTDLPPPPGGGAAFGAPPNAAVNQLIGSAIPILVFGFVLTRLQFRWFVPGSFIVLGLTLWAAILMTRQPLQDILPSAVITVGAPLAALMFNSFVQERSARGEFLANFLLDQERQEERRKRERTEAMLKVLSQATGGIVHDLGNPLTSVQTGVGTLRTFLDDGCTDPIMLGELIDIALEGTEMLNFLRLSLMEEVRVLEGRSIPVDLQRTSLRPIIEAGERYQKVRFASGRVVNLVGEDLELAVDAMRLTTVFMNLIGNALKYSDGEVRITWRTREGRLLAAVLDRGTAARGITRDQAGQLFVPFGRLETHARIEGTGLGLLSAQRIVEAHHGELYIEGHEDGTAGSPRFTTAAGSYPSMLLDGFPTAFVVVCPL